MLRYTKCEDGRHKLIGIAKDAAQAHLKCYFHRRKERLENTTKIIIQHGTVLACKLWFVRYFRILSTVFR